MGSATPDGDRAPSPLRVIVSPSSVPCSADADIPSLVTLQLSVINTTDDIVDLRAAALTIALPMDDPGADNSGRLVMYSDPPPTIGAAHARGTTWNVPPSSTQACAFVASPQGTTGKLGRRGCICFLFTDVPVDLTAGAAQISVDVEFCPVPSPEAGVVTKTPPGIGITELKAVPPAASIGDSTTIMWAVTPGASQVSLAWTPERTEVYHDGTKYLGKIDGVAAVGEATIKHLPATTTFIMTATGTGTASAVLQVIATEPDLFLSGPSGPIEQGAPTTLMWEVYNTIELPTLSWIGDGNAIVTVDGLAIESGHSVSQFGTATVTASCSTSFTLVAAGKSQTFPVTVA